MTALISDQSEAVHLVVSFSCRGSRGVADLARRHAEDLGPSEDAALRAVVCQFLGSVVGGVHTVVGGKGGRFSWSAVENGLDPRRFVEVLRPFWIELLGKFDPLSWRDWDGPSYYDSVLVLYQRAGSSHAAAIEVVNRGTWQTHVVELDVVEHHSLPFSLL